MDIEMDMLPLVIALPDGEGAYCRIDTAVMGMIDEARGAIVLAFRDAMTAEECLRLVIGSVKREANA